jgi:hypothetical protein
VTEIAKPDRPDKLTKPVLKGNQKRWKTRIEEQNTAETGLHPVGGK